ncbi:MAG: dTDP-4-dehydrorhamnose 3,5-epimerase, partial [Crenarchaeota archaeon]|nr:dTDP-4-dehydrorhamnose 3,5-epimerase [Thermoproteota archaeon]
MLPGVIVHALKRFPDERGSFVEVFRNDWKELYQADVPVQSNLSVTFPGLIRAWHRHLRGQNDYFLCIKGTLKICLFDDESGELDEVVSSESNLQVVRVPGHFWHGFKNVGNEQAM